MQTELTWKNWRENGMISRLPQGWHLPLAQLTLAWLGIAVLTAREWGEMFHQWWNIDTYNHVLLIPAMIVWLVSLRREVVKQAIPQQWLPGVAVLILALMLWLVGRATGINLFAHAGAVGAIQASILIFMGPRLGAFWLLPIAMMTFLVPFGDEVVPWLQSVTAEIAIALTMWSGIDAVYEDIYIHTPVGLFIVAEACSGVKFLIAMVTLGVLVAFTSFSDWTRRIAFLATCIIVPIIANGVRAWSTIYIAQSQGVEFAAGFDHIIYGWVFFAIVMAIILGGAWPFFQREPEDAGWTMDQITAMPFLIKLGGQPRSGPLTMMLTFAVLLGFGVAAIYASAMIG